MAPLRGAGSGDAGLLDGDAVSSAFRSICEALETTGDSGTAWFRVTEALSRAAADGPIDEARLGLALAGAHLPRLPRQWWIDLTAVGVIGPKGDFGYERARAVGEAIDLSSAEVGGREPASWKPVATIPQAFWAAPGVPHILQTLGVMRSIVEAAHRCVKIAAPFVEDEAVRKLAPSILSCGSRGVGVLLLTSTDRASGFGAIGASWNPKRRSGLRIVEVATELSPLGSHAKIVTADGVRAYVGSANITTAGLGRQFEIGAELRGPDVEDLERILEAIARLGRLVPS